MATSKKSSTSKTARVMNLLSKSRDESTEAEVTTVVQQEAAAPAAVPAAAPTAEAAAPAPAPHSSTPPLISSMQADSVISDQVLSALETALEDEFGVQQEAAAPAPAVSEVEVQLPPEPVPQPEPEPVPQPEPEPAPQSATVAEEAADTIVIDVKEDKSLLTTPPTQFHVDPATIYVNVMETLVEDKANKYIDLFGLCKCSRCVADVKAYALNHLDPKYVVMKKGDVIPRITLYEGQFAASVTAQLLTACKIIMEHPRHDR